MKKVTTSGSLVEINHLKNILESEGIPAFLKNEHLGSIIGEIPFLEADAELWVRNDLDLDRAKQLIDTANIVDESPRRTWRCKSCKEENEGQFAACWKCGAAQELDV